MVGNWKIFEFRENMIDINVWMNDFLLKLNEVFANRVLFVGLQGSYGRGEATEARPCRVMVRQGKF